VLQRPDPPYDFAMAGNTIARVSWDLPHGEEQVHWMTEEDVLVFGRAADCQICVGRVPYDECVPTLWGKLTWGGRIRVENLAERVATWSFSLYPTFAPGAPHRESPCVVSPGMESSLATPQFEIRAKAPGGLGLTYTVRVNAFPRPRPLVIEGEPASVIEVALSDAEQAVARALIRPLREGNVVPATYDLVAQDTHYSKEGVRDAIGRIDAKFASAGMYPPSVMGHAPDRVARILFDHPSLLI
jgi:hypothetical protein